MGSWLRRLEPRRLSLEALSIVSAYTLYLLVRGTVVDRKALALANAGRVIDAEQALRIFREPGWQAAMLRSDAAEWLINAAYVWGHLPVIIVVAVWLYAYHRPRYALYRNAFLISGAIGLVVFWLMPTAPPRLLQQWGFIDTASTSVGYYVWQPPAFVNQYAAMPSLHFGWNVLVTAALFAHLGRARYAVLPLPLIAGAAAVLSANHLFLDLAAGAIVALAGLWLAERLRAAAPARPPFMALV